MTQPRTPRRPGATHGGRQAQATYIRVRRASQRIGGPWQDSQRRGSYPLLQHQQKVAPPSATPGHVAITQAGINPHDSIAGDSPRPSPTHARRTRGMVATSTSLQRWPQDNIFGFWSSIDPGGNPEVPAGKLASDRLPQLRHRRKSNRFSLPLPFKLGFPPLLKRSASVHQSSFLVMRAPGRRRRHNRPVRCHLVPASSATATKRKGSAGVQPLNLWNSTGSRIILGGEEPIKHRRITLTRAYSAPESPQFNCV